MENNQIDINLSADIKTDRATTLNITMMSRDINNNQFRLSFTSNGEKIQLNDSFTVEVLSVFQKTKNQVLTTAEVYGYQALWSFDTKFISGTDVVFNYVYIKKDGVPIVSADANAFTFNVGLSKIDENAGRIAESYDQNYEKILHEFEVAVNLSKDEILAIAESEAEREANEGARKANEASRITDENTRKANEDDRKAKEVIRQASYLNKADKSYVDTELAKKASRKQEDWITPTLLNGAAGTVQYRKNEFGRVELKGTLSNIDGVNCMALPNNYRPKENHVITIVRQDKGGFYKELTITNGALYLTRPYLVGTSTIELSGLSYPTD